MTPNQRSELQAYVESVSSFPERLESYLSGDESPSMDKLDLKTATEINALLGRDGRRANGIFFSGPVWADRLIERLSPESSHRIVDPACGIGDLLVACAKRLPLAKNPKETIEEWGRRFIAHDILPELTTVAWARLQMVANARHSLESGVVEARLHPKPISFSGLDTLHDTWKLRAKDLVVMNPPFQRVPVPLWSKLTEGTCTAAMLFIERAIRDAPSGVEVAAILPDVLRSGARYKRFRGFLADHCDVHQFVPEGSFGGGADVDVAILVATVRHELRASVSELPPEARTLGKLCKVRVGTVVPHRERTDGDASPYVDVRNTAAWAAVTPSEMVTYRGRRFQPPFVVVRRTSSPKDRERARATLILGHKPVLVENHLLVLEPLDGLEATCRQMVEILKREQTTDWLNERIRCRHLTVESVSQIPY